MAYIKTDKEADLCNLIQKDDRFKGMMEIYALFRDVISHGLMADLSEKSSRVYKMAYKLDEVQEKLSYIEEAMGFLVKGLSKISTEGRVMEPARTIRTLERTIMPQKCHLRKIIRWQVEL